MTKEELENLKEETISSWLDDIVDYSDDDVIITLPRSVIIPQNKTFDLLNIDYEISTDINFCLEKLIETYYEKCIHIPGLMYQYLKDHTYLFQSHPKLIEEEEIIDLYSYDIYINVIEFKSKFGNPHYQILNCKLSELSNDGEEEILEKNGLIKLRFGNIFGGS